MRDLTPVPDLVQGTGLTGAARARRPVYVDLLPPCNAGCPAGENIQAWLAAARDGTVLVGPDMMTGCPGVFAGGDMVPAERTVTVGTGHGKKAARHIDAYLRGGRYVAPPKHEEAGFGLLHPWYFTDAPASEQPERGAATRVADFAEVTGGLTQPEAVREATRCLSCGNCFECDGCAAACPEDAVIKLGRGHRYEFDYDRCTGCSACYQQCPVHAIEMVPEPADNAVEEER